jgi:hypothetical protein
VEKRAGLDATLSLWTILDQYNQGVIGQRFYLEPEPLMAASLPTSTPPMRSRDPTMDTMQDQAPRPRSD